MSLRESPKGLQVAYFLFSFVGEPTLSEFGSKSNVFSQSAPFFFRNIPLVRQKVSKLQL